MVLRITFDVAALSKNVDIARMPPDRDVTLAVVLGDVDGRPSWTDMDSAGYDRSRLSS